MIEVYFTSFFHNGASAMQIFWWPGNSGRVALPGKEHVCSLVVPVGQDLTRLLQEDTYPAIMHGQIFLTVPHRIKIACFPTMTYDMIADCGVLEKRPTEVVNVLRNLFRRTQDFNFIPAEKAERHALRLVDVSLPSWERRNNRPTEPDLGAWKLVTPWVNGILNCTQDILSNAGVVRARKTFVYRGSTVTRDE